MYFLYPSLLSLLLFPFIYFILSFQKQTHSIESIFSQAMLKKLNPNYNNEHQLLRYRLYLMVLTLFIFALARPVEEHSSLQSRSPNTTVIVALDVSASMHKKDVYPSRLQLATEKLREIVSSASNMKIAILLYAENTYVLYPFTKDLTALSFLLKNFKIKKKFSKSTNIFSLLEASNKLFKKQKNRTILLLSDGGEEVQRDQELHYLLNSNIKLFSICTAERTNHSLQQLSRKSGGAYRDFTWGNQDIDSILEEIKQKSIITDMQTYRYKNFNELFVYPLSLAIVLLFFSFYSLSNFLPLFVLFISLYSPLLKAGVFDFYTLHTIDTAYKNKEYAKALKGYKTLKQTTKILYNTAHILYKQKKYKQAVVFYKKALKRNNPLNADIYYNIATSYLQLDKLQTAKKYYLLSLKLQNSKETQENLHVVNFLLKKRKKLLSKKNIIIKFKNRLLKTDQFIPKSSNYTIHLNKLIMSDEERWIRLLSQTQISLPLQKIPTSRRSIDANTED